LISVVPCLDTPVCDMQTRRFNEEASKLSQDVMVLTVSVDLPFAQARWCGMANARQVTTLSDHRETSFGKAYGVLIKELRLLSRAIFIVGPDDRIKYVEYVQEITQEPDYAKALEALKSVAEV
ncbi:MAG: thiol peroxidase, partial [Candidatus Omnitrophica bacterium]|nr:thiol peroxidase [Candidatus Omnitrophota bacterium]